MTRATPNKPHIFRRKSGILPNTDKEWVCFVEDAGGVRRGGFGCTPADAYRRMTIRLERPFIGHDPRHP